MNRGFGFLEIFGDDHALAERQTVRFHDCRIAVAGLNIIQCRLGVVEHLIRRAGNTVFLHEFLGENLAALDNGSLFVGTEGTDALFVQRIHHAEYQRVVRRDEYAVHGEFFSERHHAVNVRRGDIEHFRILGNAAVARRAVDFVHVGTFFELADNRMFTTAAAHYQICHDCVNPFDESFQQKAPRHQKIHSARSAPPLFTIHYSLSGRMRAPAQRAVSDGKDESP